MLDVDARLLSSTNETDDEVYGNNTSDFDFDDDDEVSYDNYIETTTDPGSTLLIIAICICTFSIVGLPLLVKLGRWLTCRRREIDAAKAKANNKGVVDGGGGGGGAGDELVPYVGGAQPRADYDYDYDYDEDNDNDYSLLLGGCECGGIDLLDDYDNVPRRRRGRGRNNLKWRKELVSRGIVRADEANAVGEGLMLDEQSHVGDDGDNKANANATTVFTWSATTPDYDDDSTILDQMKRPDPIWELTLREQLRVKMRERVDFFWTVVKYDNESMRIMQLAIPFTCSALVESISELVKLGIISHHLGINAMVAYVMVDFITGISTSFSGGWVEAVSSLGSSAYGARQYGLIGKYVQASMIGFVLTEIPFAITWGLVIGRILILMGFEEPVAILAQSFVWIKVGINIIVGMNEVVQDFLEVVDKEGYANLMWCLNSIVEVGLVAIFAARTDQLVHLGLVMACNQTIFLFLNILIPKTMGWITRFEHGLFGQFSMRNGAIMKRVFKTALPLAFGSLLAYAEWELLTIFAAILGPAEAAAWAILGLIWDMFESTTEAIGDAGEVRVSFQLGKGRPELGRLAAYKSMFFASITALVVTTTFFCLSSFLPSFLTQDATLQRMLAELFPLVALGNITMNIGMVCWALVGAQGRYRLATLIVTACSFLITIPIGALLTINLRIDLQGLTFSVVVGYTITAMILTAVLLTSDWEAISKKMQKKMAEEEKAAKDDESSLGTDSSESECSDPTGPSPEGVFATVPYVSDARQADPAPAENYGYNISYLFSC